MSERLTKKQIENVKNLIEEGYTLEKISILLNVDKKLILKYFPELKSKRNAYNKEKSNVVLTVRKKKNKKKSKKSKGIPQIKYNIPKKNKKIKKSSDELSPIQEEQIKKLYYEGYNSYEIAKKLHIRKEKISKYYNYLYNHIERERERHSIERNLDISKIKNDYANGMSIEEIKSKYHIGSDKAKLIIDSFPEKIKQQHIENINKERALILNKANDKHLYVIKNPSSNYYCVLAFENYILIKKDTGRGDQSSHITDYITPAIRSKSDYANYLKILNDNSDNIARDFTPYCIDIVKNKKYSLSEFEMLIGYF